MSIDFKSVFLDRAAEVSSALDEYLEEKNNYQKKIYEAQRYSLLGGGKRLRGVLCLTGGLLAGGKKSDVMPFACALEMIHAYSLVHDDLPAMDNDDLRRGKPSCHKKYDEATAILAGDALLNGAFELILKDSRVDSDRTLAAMKIIALASGADGMIGGQVVDLEYEGKKISKEQLLYLHSHKTGALISAALMSGYTAAGGKKENEAALKEYAEKTGLAFQVVDDILDVIGDEKTLGKMTHSDDKNGKNTFVEFLGLDGAKQYAEQLTLQAVQAVSHLGTEGEFLAWLADYLLGRKF